jgi:hypothetical protein
METSKSIDSMDLFFTADSLEGMDLIPGIGEEATSPRQSLVGGGIENESIMIEEEGMEAEFADFVEMFKNELGNDTVPVLNSNGADTGKDCRGVVFVLRRLIIVGN